MLDIFYNYNYLDLCTKTERTIQLCEDEGFHWHSNYLAFSDPGIGITCLLMFLIGLGYWILLLIVESGVFAFLFNKRGRAKIAGEKIVLIFFVFFLFLPSFCLFVFCFLFFFFLKREILTKQLSSQMQAALMRLVLKWSKTQQTASWPCKT